MFQQQFEDWLEANDMAVSVYVALIVDASCSRTLAANAPRGEWESRADSSSAQ
jgi:hypothetical protein